MKQKTVLFLVIVAVIIASALAVAAPGFASGGCTFVPQHGWHILGGGQLNDHWFDTEEECLIALQVPTLVATLSTLPPTETDVPTLPPTEEPTLVPTATEPPVITETVVPTDTATESPTEPPVVTETPSGTVVPTWTPAAPSRKGLNCQRAWEKITETVYERETGFRFFENPNHAYCESWLLIKHGIVWDVYKVQHPLE